MQNIQLGNYEEKKLDLCQLDLCLENNIHCIPPSSKNPLINLNMHVATNLKYLTNCSLVKIRVTLLHKVQFLKKKRVHIYH